jgi:hypothetical protein
MAWDSELGPLADLVGGCAEAVDAAAGSLDLQRLVVETPVELQSARSADGSVSVGVAPPRQALATTVMPVLHRLRIVVVAEP